MKKVFTNLLFWFDDVGPLRFFVATAALFGLILIIITPPFEAPDEPVHFYRSYQVSQLNLSVDKVGDTYGGLLPQSLQDTVSLTWDKPAVAFHPAYKYSLHTTRQALSIKTTPKMHVYDFSTTAYYSPVSYIPQAIGVGIGRLAKTPPVVMMYLGRIFNLAAWVALFGLAIKFIPRRKWALVFIGLIPMALFQAASLSADVGAVGLLALSLALVLKLREGEQRLGMRQILLVLLLLSALALSKQIMFLFLPIVLLLPKRLFYGRRQEILVKSGLVIVPLILFGLWGLHVHGIPQSNSVGGIDPTRQENFVLHHPLQFGYVLIREYYFNWGDGIIKSFFGNFGWVDTPLAEGFVVLGYISMFLVMVADDGEKPAKKWLDTQGTILVILMAVIYVITVTAALYVYFTPVAFKVVIGPVGRYFYPAALVLIPVLGGRWLRLSPLAYKRIAVWSPLILLIISLTTIYARYYLNYI